MKIDLDLDHSKETLRDVFGVSEERGREIGERLQEEVGTPKDIGYAIDDLCKIDWMTKEEKILALFKLGYKIGSDKARMGELNSVLEKMVNQSGGNA